jgi:transcriptional regulator with PAS, ATPase and Fis domain
MLSWERIFWSFPEKAIYFLSGYEWNGNRELKNIIAAA